MFKKIRDPNNSNSDLGQWIHDNLPHVMSFMDVDGVIYERNKRLLRIVEQKQPGQSLKYSQQLILPIIAKALDLLIECGDLHPRSGVFVLWGIEPYETCEIQKIGNEKRHTITHEQFVQFCKGK